MDLKRVIGIIHKIRFACIIDGCNRAEYIRKHNLFASMGSNCMFQSRHFPMDPKMVKIHDNVSVAADVIFCTHDAIRHVFQNYDNNDYVPHMGCIEIDDNVFVGLGSIIMPNVYIGKNSIIAAGSLVLRDVPSGSIVGGHPAKIIGSFDDLHKKRVEEGRKLAVLSHEELEFFYWQEFYKSHYHINREQSRDKTSFTEGRCE